MTTINSYQNNNYTNLNKKNKALFVYDNCKLKIKNKEEPNL
jgi:hypothetical protein